VEEVATWLQERLPAPSETTVVHGDYRLGNVLLTAGPPRLTAVLDWEMATLGDPLADVGYLVAMWSVREDPPWLFDLSPVTRLEGFPDRGALLRRYAAGSGRDVSALSFHVVLALWKSIVIMEGNHRRALEGASDDPFLRQFGDGVVDIARRAHRFGPDGDDVCGV
jgi:aminoglycoside phosphotransferase (APT) family kinase protein